MANCLDGGYSVAMEHADEQPVAGNDDWQEIRYDALDSGASDRKSQRFARQWSLVLDSRGRIHILDTYNHRVQRIRL